MTNISSLTSPFILATVPRSGTHWLANMLISSGLDGVTRSNPNLSYDNILKEIRTDSWKKLRAGVFLYDHIRYNGIADLVTQSEVKSLVLYRDPRDKLVSNYYYTKYIFKKHNRSFSESFDELVPIILNQYNDIAVAWLNYKNTLPLRYEDLVGNTADELSRIFELIGHKSKMDVNIIAEKYSFKRLSGGREPGEMKKDHHYRNGQPGDWKNHFTEDLLLRYREVFGELHISLGYELD